ncbi:hypothetical protein BA190_26805 [Labrys sp. WJW]|uniref:hypothetical protein n=1 Tax=Labrys sp. WJW TaxID=1737983 RepID=UPI00082FE054|nr:hypothetical protein [Labrys sp. WJW]OCC01825.1 hypothetical protein BA190_26805 [Labrys sp. WJW]
MDRNVIIASAMAERVGRVLAYNPERFDELAKNDVEIYRWIEGVEGLSKPVEPKDDLHYEVGAQLLAGFVRNHSTAPIEALFRMAQGQGLHADPVDGWADLPFPRRVAFSVFATMLGLLDSESDIEEERQELRQRLAGSTAPVLASALSADPRDTIFEQHPDPLETNPHMTLKRIDDAPDVSTAGEGSEPQTPSSPPEEGVGTASDERLGGSEEGQDGTEGCEASVAGDAVDPAVLEHGDQAQPEEGSADGAATAHEEPGAASTKPAETPAPDVMQSPAPVREVGPSLDEVEPVAKARKGKSRK